MNENLRALSGILVALFVMSWVLRGWWQQHSLRAQEVAFRSKVECDVAPAWRLWLSSEAQAFADAALRGDGRVRGPSLLASDIWDLYRLVSAVNRGAVERVLVRLLDISDSNNPLHGVQRDDRKRLTLLYAFALAMHPGGFRLTRVADEFVLVNGRVEVTIGPRGALRIAPLTPRLAAGVARAAWVRGPRRWPRWPLGRELTAAARRSARVPGSLRQLLSSSEEQEVPLDAGLFVTQLAAALEKESLERAAVRRRLGSPEVLHGCSSAQLALLLCLAAKVAGNANPVLLAIEFDGIQAFVSKDGVVRDGWLRTHLGGPEEPSGRPERGFEFHLRRALLGGLIAGGVAQAATGRPWMAALAMVLWVALEWGRAYLGALSDLDAATAIPFAVGIAVGSSYGVVYITQVIIFGMTLALGVPVREINSLGWLPVLPFFAFVIGLSGQLILRRYLTWVRQVRSVMLLVQSVSLVGVALAPNIAVTGAWLGLAGLAASTGVLLKSEATAEQNALRETRGVPLRGMNLTFIGTIGLLLIAPALLPETGRGWFLGLAPTRVVFLVLALLSFASWRLLPKLLELKEGTWEDAQPVSLRDAPLWRAIGVTALTLGAQTPILNRLNEIFLRHGSATPILWTSLLELSIVATAMLMPKWDRFQRSYQRRAEAVGIAMSLAAGVVGLLSLVLGLRGFSWYMLISVSTVVMDGGVTFVWACAEAEALTMAEDVGRSALVNISRNTMTVGVGLAASVLASSELLSIWVPALTFSALALLVFLWRPASGAQPGPGGERAEHSSLCSAFAHQ